MTRIRHNTQMFALPARPPQRIEIKGCGFTLVGVFKHDFFAATCLYEASDAAQIPKIVVKFGRQQSFCGLPLRWVGQFLADREEAIYHTLQGIQGVPRWVGRFDATCYAIQYIQARPLDHIESPPPGFFDRLGDLMTAIHNRGVAYGDANKRSNILVGEDGQPFLVDYQLALRRRDDWPWPVRTILAALVDWLAAKDLYHLYKHKRRLAPQELCSSEEALSRQRKGIHRLHRKLTKPYRNLRRWLLRKQYDKGALQSPTADLEDHHQPEKATWRKT